MRFWGHRFGFRRRGQSDLSPWEISWNAPALEVDVLGLERKKLGIGVERDSAASAPVEVHGVLGRCRRYIEARRPQLRRDVLSRLEQLGANSQPSVIPADVEERQLDEVACGAQTSGINDGGADQTRVVEDTEKHTAAVERGLEQRHRLRRLERWPSGNVEEGWPQDQSAVSDLIDPFDELSAVDGPEQADLRALKSSLDQGRDIPVVELVPGE
jgi:hypothetical protein